MPIGPKSFVAWWEKNYRELLVGQHSQLLAAAPAVSEKLFERYREDPGLPFK